MCVGQKIGSSLRSYKLVENYFESLRHIFRVRFKTICFQFKTCTFFERKESFSKTSHFSLAKS